MNYDAADAAYTTMNVDAPRDGAPQYHFGQDYTYFGDVRARHSADCH